MRDDYQRALAREEDEDRRKALKTKQQQELDRLAAENRTRDEKNARELAELVRGIRAKVNLIALNPGPGIDFSTPEMENVLEFQKILMGSGIPAFIRRPRGRDIYAACGQLKRTVELST